jgi:hypothetical protein
MSNTTKINDPSGKEVEINVFSPADLKAFYEDKSGPGMKAAFAYLKQLGRPVGEIISMDAAHRFEWTTKRYDELGIATGGKKAKGPTPVAAAKGKAAAAAKAATQVADDEEDGETEEEEESAPPAKAGPRPVAAAARAVSGAASGDKEIRALKEAVTTLQEQLGEVLGVVKEQSKLLLDVHFITRIMGPQLTGMDDESLIDLGNEQGVLNKLLIELDEGNV